MFNTNKRHFLLLEVIIAFAIIVLAIFPIIAPNVAIVRAQRDFGTLVEFDHVVNLLYGDMLQRLYMNEIPWNVIEEGKWIDIDKNEFTRIGYDKPLPFTGKYQFEILNSKPPPPAPRRLYKVLLRYEFTPDASMAKATPPLKYEYIIYMERHTQDEAQK